MIRKRKRGLKETKELHIFIESKKLFFHGSYKRLVHKATN